MIERLVDLKSLIRYIREGRPFYYLPDQDMGERASVFVPFFGIPVATVTALSRIARSMNAIVIPFVARIRRDNAGWEATCILLLKTFRPTIQKPSPGA
jgi:KDO2-lipid IV(A) lauroyltransferase